MAEFHLWSKDTLIGFAEAAALKIEQLEADNKLLREAWRREISTPTPCAVNVASDTVTPP